MMARPLPLDIEDGVYHVTSRGGERRVVTCPLPDCRSRSLVVGICFVDRVFATGRIDSCGQRLLARWLVKAGGAEATKFASSAVTRKIHDTCN